MEFGPDFAFVGNQYRIEVDGKEYFIDLLLYNRRLQAMIAIELKIGEFLPEYKGKMEFYLNVLNDTVRLPHENPAIGIIICKSKSRMIVEYALKARQCLSGWRLTACRRSCPKPTRSCCRPLRR